jgi:hypothetical protein
VVGIFLIGCVVLLVVGCLGTRSASSEKKQGHSPQATASEEEARCDETQNLKLKDLYKLKNPWRGGFGKNALVTTNDLPGCPKGGLLSGTDRRDKLDGGEGDDEVRALGGYDTLAGGKGNDVVYGGPGSDDFDDPDKGDDVFYGGEGNDGMWAGERMSSMAGMATIPLLTMMGSGTSSIAVLARTYTGLTRTTMWTAVARRRPASEEALEPLGHRGIAHSPGPESPPRRGHYTSSSYYRCLLYIELSAPDALHKKACCIGLVLCRILHANFRECLFHALR